MGAINRGHGRSLQFLRTLSRGKSRERFVFHDIRRQQSQFHSFLFVFRKGKCPYNPREYFEGDVGICQPNLLESKGPRRRKQKLGISQIPRVFRGNQVWKSVVLWDCGFDDYPWRRLAFWSIGEIIRASR